jgi:SAM-dependent methyltransferase
MEHLSSIAEQSALRTAPVCGSISDLPLADGSFDAIWCANTLQYLDDDEAIDVLRDFARAVRPGGIVAIKDVDMTAFKFSPAPPFLGAHLAEACASGENITAQSRGSIRGRELRRLLETAGLANVRQRSFVIERFGPLTGYDARFWSEWLPFLASLAEVRGVPEEDLQTWRKVAKPALADAFVTDPGFYGCELQVVCTGRSPA